MSTRIILRMLAAGWLALAFWGLSIDGATARQSVATVGPDGQGCDFSPSQAQGEPIVGEDPDLIGRALLAGFDEIRVVRFEQTLKEDLFIGRSVTLRGGFDDCADAEIGNENPTVATGVEAKNGRFLTASASGANQIEIRIRRLTIRSVCDAGDGSPVQQGGAINLDGEVTMTLERTTISGRACGAQPVEEGGLVYLTRGASFRAVEFSVLQGGKAGNGGAIFCTPGGRLFLGPASNLFSNEALIPDGAAVPTQWGNGGGLYADECSVTIVSRRDDRDPISRNKSDRHGGFIYAVNGSNVWVSGGANCDSRRPDDLAHLPCDERLPSTIADGKAGADGVTPGEGGAIYASGSETYIALDGVELKTNSSTAGGGAISSRNGARLQIGVLGYTFDSLDKDVICGSIPCAYFEGNVAEGGRGGAIFIDGAGPTTIWFAEFRNNRANFGSAISLNQQAVGSPFDLASSVFASNGSDGSVTADFGLIEFDTTGPDQNTTVALTGVTFFGNQGSDGATLLYGQTPANVSSVSVSGSLFVGNGLPLQLQALNAGISGDCIVSDDTIPNTFVNSLFKQTVELEDPLNRDYRPRVIDPQTPSANPAVDFCTVAQMQPPAIASSRDFLFNERPKLGSVFSADAPFDAGAIELQLVPSDDEIYHDRFEGLPPVIIQ